MPWSSPTGSRKKRRSRRARSNSQSLAGNGTGSTQPPIRSGSETMPKMKQRPETSDAVEILHRRYFEGKPEMMAMLEEELVNAELSRLVYDLRTKAKLT